MAILRASMDAYAMNFLTPRYLVRWVKRKKNLKLGGLMIILKDHTVLWAIGLRREYAQRDMSKQIKTLTTLPELTLALV